jgi:hypothetical protein
MLIEADPQRIAEALFKLGVLVASPAGIDLFSEE